MDTEQTERPRPESAPFDSKIIRIDGDEHVHLQWTEKRNLRTRVILPIFAAVWSYGEIWGIIGLGWALLNGGIVLPLLMALVLLAIFWVSLIWFTWYICWPAAPESITLYSDLLCYNPGRGFSRMFCATTTWRENPAAFRNYPGFYGFPGLFRGHKRITAPIDAFDGFYLDSGGPPAHPVSIRNLRLRNRCLFG